MTKLQRILLLITIVAIVVVGFLVSPFYPPVAGILGGYDASIRSGRREIPAITQFCELYPASSHQISYYTGWYGSPMWTSKVGLRGRYILTMQMPISFDALRTTVHQIEQPRFHLEEIESVNARPGGAFEIIPGHTFEFGLAEWDRVCGGSGDFNVIGITLRHDSPIPGFEHVLIGH